MPPLSREYLEAYWDDRHGKNAVGHIGEDGYRDACRAFSHVGDFTGSLEGKDVLEIGPGFGACLNEAQARRKYAVEISGVARARLAGQGVVCFSPYEVPKALDVDVVYAMSVFQHVEDEMLGALMDWASTALRPAGLFFVQFLTDEWSVKDEEALSCGRCSHTVTDLVDAGRRHGLIALRQWSAPVAAYPVLVESCLLFVKG